MLLGTGINNLINLQKLYLDGDIVKKREIIGSIFPEKLTFYGFSYRTARLNESVQPIFNPGAARTKQKKGQAGKTDLSLFRDLNYTIFEPFLDRFEAVGKAFGLKINI